MKIKSAIAGMGMLIMLILSGCRLVRLVRLHNSTKKQISQPATDRTIDIPFSYQQDWIMLHLRVKQGTNSLEGEFVFDSGASTSLFDSCKSIRIWIPEKVAGLPVQGALGKSYRQLKIAKDVVLQAGQFTVMKPSLLVTKKQPFFPANCLGIIGIDFFRDYVLTIDFKQKILRVQVADGFNAEGMVAVGMKTIGNGNPVLQKMVLGDLPAMDYLVDAGNSGSLLIQKPDAQSLIATLGPDLREYAFKQDDVKDGSGGMMTSNYYTRTAATIDGFQCPEYEVAGLVNRGSVPKYGNMGLAFLKQVFESICFDFSERQFYYKISSLPFSSGRMDREVYFSWEDSAFLTGPVLIHSAWYKQGLKPGMQVTRINGESPAVYIEERKAGRTPELRSVTFNTADGKSLTITN